MKELEILVKQLQVDYSCFMDNVSRLGHNFNSTEISYSQLANVIVNYRSLAFTVNDFLIKADKLLDKEKV